MVVYKNMNSYVCKFLWCVYVCVLCFCRVWVSFVCVLCVFFVCLYMCFRFVFGCVFVLRVFFVGVCCVCVGVGAVVCVSVC